MTLQKQAIIHALKKNSKVLNKFGIKKLGLFGSVVRNENGTGSDIDILVQFEQGKKSYDNFYALYDFLENLFQVKIELLTTESLSRHIGQDILKEVEYIEIAA